MRAKFLCQLSEKLNGIRKIHLVRDQYHDAKSQPTEILIIVNSTDTFCHEGDTCMVEITVIPKGSNGGNKR